MTKLNAQCVLLLTCAFLAGCSAKHPVTSNPQPALASTPRPKKSAKPKPSTYALQIPKEGDVVVRGCTVTKEAGNKADCVCRRAVTQLAVENPEKTTIQCR